MITGANVREEFTVVLPDGWHRLELDPARRDASIRTLVRRAWGTAEEHATIRHQLFVSYREMAETAAEQGAFFCALLQDTIDGLPVSASVLGFVRPSPVDGAGEPFESVEAMADVLGAPAADEERLSCEVVDLAVGRAVQSRALVPSGARATDGEEIRSDCVRYFVPLDGDRLLVLVFSTPLLPLGDALAELFAGIAHTGAIGEPMSLADLSIGAAVRFELPWFVCLAGGWGEPGQLDRAVAQRIEIEPDLEPWADVLRSQVLSVAEDFRREGAIVGALRFQHDPVFGLVTAYCSATLVPLDGPLDGAAMLERLRDDLGGSQPADASLPEIQDVELGGRPSLRVAITRLAPEVVPGEGRPAFIVLEHWTPVAEVPGHVVRLAAMTSRLAFAGELTTEFDAIAATLQITVGS